jgi:hypothetical protein
LVLALAGSPTASALPITFVKIVDTNTPAPGGFGDNFSSFGNPAISGGTVAFRAEAPGFRGSTLDGIYSYDGALHVVADRRSQPGDPTGAFFGFGDPSISGSNVAFGATFAPDDHSPFTSGLFVKDPAGITPIVDLHTASPSDPRNNFSALGNPMISGGTTVFHALTPGFRDVSLAGIYSYDGTLHIVADRRSQPGDPTGAFFDFGNPSIGGDSVAFGATFAPNDHSPFTTGLFVANASGITPIVDLNTPSPSDPRNNFSGLGNPVVSGDEVAFRAETPGFRGVNIDGIYLYDGTSLHIVADRRSQPGDPTGAFFNFSDPAISDNNVLFGANFAPNDHSAPTNGLFVSLDGVIEEIIHRGDLLDGLTVDGLTFGVGGVDGNSLAFLAQFTDGSSAVYRADIGSVPEPNSLLLLVLAGCSMLFTTRALRSR